MNESSSTNTTISSVEMGGLKTGSGSQAGADGRSAREEQQDMGGNGSGSDSSNKRSTSKLEVGHAEAKSDTQVQAGNVLEGSGQTLSNDKSDADQHRSEPESISTSVASGASSSSDLEGFAGQLKLLRDPVVFCQTFCASHEYTDKQRAFLRDCRVVDENGLIDQRQWPRTVVYAAVNGSGKTEILADVIRYLLSTVPGCLIPITSPIYRQLEMLESYLKAQNHKFPDWSCIEGKLTAPNGNVARWFATDTPTAVESFHAPFLVRIIEEAKAMPDHIFDQTNRWQPKLTIIVSSKGLVQGRLYEALTKNREYNRVHEVDAFECPWIGQAWIEEQIREHGRNSAIIKSMIFNEFSDVDVRNLINIEQINRCFGNPPPWRDSGVRVAGIDFSAAKKDGDEIVCTKIQGNKVFEPYIVPACDAEMEAVGLVLRWLRAEKIHFAFGDVGSMGGTMMSRLREVMDDKSIQIHEVGFGSKAISPLSHCKNRGTELWKNLANKLEMRDLIFDWSSATKAKFIAQATSRAVENTSDGQIKLESKDKMRARGLKSPDLVDSVSLALTEIQTHNQNRSIFGTDLKDWNQYKSGDNENQKFGFTSSGKRLGRG